MKLLCINNKEIKAIHYDYATGEGLEEGKIYQTKGKPFIGESGLMCYYIDGLGAKACCRFTELLDDSEIMLAKLKEEFQLN